MPLKEVQTYKTSHLSQIPFSIVWSEDNIIAQACESAVYVSEYIPNPRVSFPMLTFERDCITLKRLYPTQNCGVDIPHLTRVLGEKDLYDLLQSSYAYPLVSLNQRDPVIKQIAWSPLAEPHHRSVLAVLTDTGAITLSCKVKKSWVTSSCLTDSWTEYNLKKCVKLDEISPEAILASLKCRARSIKINCFCWGKNNIFGEKNTNTLYVCTLSGSIGIWQIEASPNKLLSRQPHIALIQVIHSGLEQPTCVLQDPFLSSNNRVAKLYLSAVNGQLKMIELTNKNEVVVLSQSVVLWEEEDRVTIPPGGLFTDSSDGLTYLLGAKGPHVLVFTIDSHGKVLNKITHNSQHLNITGFAKTSNGDILVTTIEGQIFSLELGDNHTTSLKKSQGSFRSPHFSCYGIAVSNNGVLAALPFSISSNYNHLVQREPTSVILAYMSDISEVVTLLLAKSQSVTPIIDALDAFRIHCILAKKGPDMFESRKRLNLDTCSIYDLRKYYWLIHCTMFTLEDDPKAVDDLKLLRHEIMMIQLLKNLELLLSKFDLKNMTEKPEGGMLRAVRKWVDYFLSQVKPDCPSLRATALKLRSMLDKSTRKLGEETCLLCLSVIGPFGSLFSSQCEKKHNIGRCSISFAQFTIPYYTCLPCNTVATQWAAEKTEPQFVCITCGSYLRFVSN